MEELLTPVMKEQVAALGALIKADPRSAAVEHAVEDYERSPELNALIAEYNAQQNLLADAFGKEDKDAELAKTVQARIDTLYREITTHPVYVAYLEAKAGFDALINEVYGELQYVITGQRPCSHNCASCHADCSGNH